jgi:hypothetical protein
MLVILALVLGGLVAAWYLTQEDSKAVPSVTGMTLDQAVAELESEGFSTDIENRADQADEGTVFEQEPTSGTEAEEGSTVQVLVSTGPATRPVPNAVGLEETVARDRMADAGLEVNVVEVFSDEPDGTVVAQNPPAGRQVGEGGDGATQRLQGHRPGGRSVARRAVRRLGGGGIGAARAAGERGRGAVNRAAGHRRGPEPEVGPGSHRLGGAPERVEGP